MRFNLDNTSIIVANVHLESGQKQLQDRLFQFSEIINDKLIGKRNRSYEFKSHTIRVLIGDMNFRLDMDYEEAKVSAVNFREDDIHILHSADQLIKARANLDFMKEV